MTGPVTGPRSLAGRTAMTMLALGLTAGSGFGGQAKHTGRSATDIAAPAANELLKLGVYHFDSRNGVTIVRTSTQWSSLHPGDALRVSRARLRRLLAAACAGRQPAVMLEVTSSKGPERRRLQVRCLSM